MLKTQENKNQMEGQKKEGNEEGGGRDANFLFYKAPPH